MMPRVGDVVEITGRMKDPDPLPIGLRGTVTNVFTGSLTQIWVDWHGSNRSLMLLAGDPFRIVAVYDDLGW